MQANQPVTKDDADNVVPISSLLGLKNNRAYENLRTIFEHFAGKNAQTDARLDTLDAQTENVAATTERLSSQTASLTSSVKDLAGELHTTGADVESSLRKLDERAGTAESRLDLLDDKSQQIQAVANELDTRTVALEHRSDALEETDNRLAGKAGDLKARLDTLEPSHQKLEHTSRRLAQDTNALQSKAEWLATRFKQATWITAGVILILAVSAGTASWFGMAALEGIGSDANAQIADLRTNLTGRIQGLEAGQSKVTEIHQRLGLLQQQVDARVVDSAALRNEYMALSRDIQGLDGRLLTMNEQFQAELGIIKERLYSGDEDLRGAAFDLSTLRSTSWLQAQNPKHYVVQLVNVYRKRELASFIARHQGYLPLDQLSYFKTVHRGRDIYVLLFGNYPRFSQAIEKAEALPAPLQRNRPYLRTIKGVQNTMS